LRNRGRIDLPARNLLRTIAILTLGMLSGMPTAGHAILVESVPAANSTVRGPDVNIRLRFNSRIDAGRSRLTLVLPDGATEPLKLGEQPSADTLTSAVTGMKRGDYKIQWQVLAADGHITRGEIRFTVGGA